MPRKNHESPRSRNAIDLLVEDHQEVLSLFEDFKSLQDDEDVDDDVKQTLVERICTELTIHSEIEEELLYPAMRDAFADHALLDEAEVEHAIAEQLIAELESMEPGDDLYDAKVSVLGEYVRHHIDEEQEKLFPKAKKAKMDLDTLGEELLLRKEELRTEFGLPDENDGAIEEDE
ncbi:MAG TPA: hemerythrin domain-containing protein [Paucimonas sp.]|nr:hemerythrin domain-containing protein [Paucimonas sp.]